MFQVCVSC